MTSNSYIIDQMRRESIAEALEHFGMGDVGDGETAEIAATVGRMTLTTVQVEAMNLSGDGAERFRLCEFPRAEVAVRFYNSTAALVRVPAAYIEAFGLHRFRLTGHPLEILLAMVDRHNAPYLPKPSDVKPVRVGALNI